MGFDRCAQKRVLVRTEYHRADMVKWLSSEVSNLMSWVRLPLSAPFHHLEEASLGLVRLATIKGSPGGVRVEPSVMTWNSLRSVC